MVNFKENNYKWISVYGLTILMFVMQTYSCKSQLEYISFDPFFIKYYKGIVALEGSYRNRQFSSDDESANQFLFRSNFKLSTSAFLFRPDILSLDIDGEYSPSINPNKLVGMPEISENINTNSITGQMDLLNVLPIKLNIFGNISNSTITMEFGNKIKSISQGYGISSNFPNDILPVSAIYSKNSTNQQDLFSLTNYISNVEQFSGSTRRDIGEFMNNNLNVSYQKIRTQYYSKSELQNNVFDIALSDNLNMLKGNVQLNSNTSYTNTLGNFNNKRLNEILNLNILLPYRFKLSGIYNYLKNSFDSLDNVNNTPKIQLEHQLYSNLNSIIYYQSQNSVVSNKGIKIYNEKFDQFGGIFSYTKRIPTGRFGIVYDIREQIIKRDNSSKSIIVKNEEYSIEDGNLTFLKYPNVQENSIVIRDETGTLIYQRDIDYLLILVNTYYQIARIPTGRILNNSKVYIDYTTNVTMINNSDNIYQSLNFSLSLFNGILSTYFKISENNYKNIEQADLNLLKIDHVKSVGFSLNIGKFNSNGSYTVVNSNISPNSNIDFHASYYDNLLNDLSTNLQANLSDQK